ncbi:MAG: (2Fe-2S)-binding protein [Pseudomonadota bacterium]
MIVCSCNIITKHEIEEVVRGFLEQDRWQLITVGMVYHAMRKRGKCCGCFPNAIGIIVDFGEKWHRENNTPQAQILSFVERMRLEHQRTESLKNLAKNRKNGLAA